MQNDEQRFLSEIGQITQLNKKNLDRNLRFLCKRGLMDFKKKVDTNLQKRRACNLYFINRKGIQALNYNQKHNPFDYEQLIKQIKQNKKTNPTIKERNKNFIGKNQKKLLEALKNEKSLFVRELIDITSLNSDCIIDCINLLWKRNLVKRKKEVDASSTRNNKNFYRYSITEKGSSIINSSIII